MKASEIRKLTDQEIFGEIDKLVRERLALRVQQTVEQTAKTDRFTKIKKSIARMLTVINERKKLNNED
jgi:large subunit ribosomal protein L29